MDKETFNKNLQKEKAKIHSLDNKAKLTYLWDYYKIPIVGAVALVGIIIYFCYVIAVRPPESAFYASFINSYAEISEGSDFFDEFAKYAQIDTSKNSINLETGSYFDLSTNSGFNNAYYEKTVAIVESGMVDVIVCDKDNYYNLSSSGLFLNLEDEKVADIYKTYKDRVLTTKHAETGEEVKVGIDVSDSEWFKKLNTYSNGAVVLISPKAPHLDKVKPFIDFLVHKSDQ